MLHRHCSAFYFDIRESRGGGDGRERRSEQYFISHRSLGEFSSVNPLFRPTPPKSILTPTLDRRQLAQNFQKALPSILPIPNLTFHHLLPRSRMVRNTLDGRDSSCCSARGDFVEFSGFYFGEGD